MRPPPSPRGRGTVRLASRILNPQPPTKPFRSPLLVEYIPPKGCSFNPTDLLYAHITIHSVDGQLFDERQENAYLVSESVVSPPSRERVDDRLTKEDALDGIASPRVIQQFEFSGEEGPVFRMEAAGRKIGLKVEVGNYASGDVLADLLLLPVVKVMKPYTERSKKESRPRAKEVSGVWPYELETKGHKARRLALLPFIA